MNLRFVCASTIVIAWYYYCYSFVISFAIHLFLSCVVICHCPCRLSAAVWGCVHTHYIHMPENWETPKMLMCLIQQHRAPSTRFTVKVNDEHRAFNTFAELKDWLLGTQRWTHLCRLSPAIRFVFFWLTALVHYDASTIILAVVGMLGLFATAIVATYAFKRNQTSKLWTFICRSKMRLWWFNVLFHNQMIILETTNFGYTYIDDNGDYFSVIDNSDCNAVNDVYPLMLGPFENFMKGFDEAPFWTYTCRLSLAICFHVLYITQMSDIFRLQTQLARAEEQLMQADTMDAQFYWGNKCDQLEAAIADALVAPAEWQPCPSINGCASQCPS